jgi:hypothetical protein
VLSAGEALGTAAPDAATVARLKGDGYTYFVGSVKGLMNTTFEEYAGSVKASLS